MKKFYVIAGEASGDLHASNMMRALKERDSTIDFRFWGGDHMAAVAGQPVKHIRDLAFMGFVEVLLNLKTILSNIRFCKEDIAAYQPDALILIDYPGFNLRIAEWAKSQGIKVYYYISPQIWAWKQNRVHKIKKVVDKMFVILPFEQAFYDKFDVEVTYVGHPLMDAVKNYQENADETTIRKRLNLSDKPVIAVLPGSRKQEISSMLPIMLKAINELDETYQVVIAGAPAQDPVFYEPFMKGYQNVKVVHGVTYELLHISTAALVTSGTATLETAIFNVPQVVCYKGSFISYHIAKRLIKVAYISLVNLILDKEAVRELIQDECNVKNALAELKAVMPEGKKREAVLSNYSKLHQLLGKGGASKLVAQHILSLEN